VNGWLLRAACRSHDPDLWFPDTPGVRSSARAKAICRDCPVRNQCLALALNAANDDAGIYAGLTAFERKQIRSQRSQPLRPGYPRYP